MTRIGYHAVYEPDYKTAILLASENGFNFVQFDLNVPHFYLEHLSRHELTDIRNLLADSDVGISFHAPGDNVSLFSDYPPIQKGILDYFGSILDVANDLGAHHLTVHPLKPPSFRRSDTATNDFQSKYFEYYSKVLEHNITVLAGQTNDTLVCVENCSFGPIAMDSLSRLLVKSSKVKLTLDIAKLHTQSFDLDQDQCQFFSRHKDYIKGIHLHDMDHSNRSHLCIGNGKIDFQTILSQFLNSDIWLTIEVRPFSEALRSKKLLEEKVIIRDERIMGR
jgi:sugar phosphate isomerase/epimerase